MDNTIRLGLPSKNYLTGLLADNDPIENSFPVQSETGTLNGTSITSIHSTSTAVMSSDVNQPSTSRYTPTNVKNRKHSLESDNDYAATISKISKIDTTPIQGKHTVNKPSSQWINYGNPEEWDRLFEESVINAVKLINENVINSSNIIGHFECVRQNIAYTLNTARVNLFGLRKNYNSKVYYTVMMRSHIAYGYALERAIKIKHDENNFIESWTEDGNELKYLMEHTGNLRASLVQGYIDDKAIPLTQYLFYSRTSSHHETYELKRVFGHKDEDYIGDKKESAVWVHTSAKQIPVVEPHIEKLIDKAINRDLTVIPRIHWWYVHLAPVLRGPGGVAEMLTNSLCRLHGIDLPPWKTNMAPSVEMLLEPDEEKLCDNYYQFFSEDQQESLKILFKNGLTAYKNSLDNPTGKTENKAEN